MRKYLKYFNRSQSIANFLGKIRVSTPFLLQKLKKKKRAFFKVPQNLSLAKEKFTSAI